MESVQERADEADWVSSDLHDAFEQVGLDLSAQDLATVTLVAEVDWPSVRAHVERLNDING